KLPVPVVPSYPAIVGPLIIVSGVSALWREHDIPGRGTEQIGMPDGPCSEERRMQIHQQRESAARLHRIWLVETGVTIGAVAILPRPQQHCASTGRLDRSEYCGGRISKRAARVGGALRGRAAACGDGNYQRNECYHPRGRR